jgi:23S rRNA (adenine2503-C2)-methyltransferase
LVPGIRRLAEEALPINLAVSLHAADDGLRDQLAPVNRRYPLAELMAAVRDYAGRTKRRVSIEYALIEGVNDAPEQAHGLAWLLEGLLCHVNLIPLNPTSESPWQPSPRERVDAFRAVMEAAGVPTTVRMRRGIDIEAGCGQLRRRHLSAVSDS